MHSPYPLHHGGFFSGASKKTFCSFTWYYPVLSSWFKICVLVLGRSTQILTQSGFMEKQGIEPAIPGL